MSRIGAKIQRERAIESRAARRLIRDLLPSRATSEPVSAPPQVPPVFVPSARLGAVEPHAAIPPEDSIRDVLPLPIAFAIALGLLVVLTRC